MNRIEINSHIGHVKDLPQGFITAVIHFDQVCSGEAVVVPLLAYLLGHMENPSLQKHSCTHGSNLMFRTASYFLLLDFISLLLYLNKL